MMVFSFINNTKLKAIMLVVKSTVSVIIGVLVFILFMQIQVQSIQAGQVTYVKQETMTDIVNATVTVNVVGKSYPNTNIKLYSGRLFLPITVMQGFCHMSLSEDNLIATYDGNRYSMPLNLNKSIPNILVINKEVYLNAYEFVGCLDMVISVDNIDDIIGLYKKSQATKDTEATCKIYTNEESENNQTGKDYKSAYLRLEDIMADGLDSGANPDYTYQDLIVLREMIDILYQNNQQYYVAWIPVYVNPNTDYVNNLLTERNLYNADFIGTLDYMVSHNGKIGLHGYTHQYGSDKSAVGYEWGSNTTYSIDEQEDRFIYAKNTAEKLGLDYYFFEFPHYDATETQSMIAEKYFDVIYQKYDGASETEIYNHNGTYWMPTPADYIYYDGYVPMAMNRIKEVVNQGKLYSIFYHPKLDAQKLDIHFGADTGEVDIFRQGYTNLFALLQGTENLGYSFRYFS